MITEEQVRTALKQVFVPTAEQSIIDLNLVRKITVADKNITVTLASTALADEVQNFVAAGVKSTLQQFKNTLVQVDFVEAKPADLNEIKNIVAVMSGKGGVGKSLVTALLAIALKRQGKNVGILDADITGASIPRMFGITTRPFGSETGLLPVVSQSGIEVMSMNLLLPQEESAVIWRAPLLSKAITQFWTDVVWGKLDYLLIDLPPGTGDASLSLAQMLPLSGVVIVTLPQAVSLEDASRGLNMFQTLEVPILGVIENMRGEFFGSGGGEDLARIAKVPFLGAVPMEQAVRVGGDTGQPVVVSRPDSAAAKAFQAIAGQVAARVSVEALNQKAAPTIAIE